MQQVKYLFRNKVFQLYHINNQYLLIVLNDLAQATDTIYLFLQLYICFIINIVISLFGSENAIEGYSTVLVIKPKCC